MVLYSERHYYSSLNYGYGERIEEIGNAI